jgi:hypothetical protein
MSIQCVINRSEPLVEALQLFFIDSLKDLPIEKSRTWRGEELKLTKSS